MSEYTPSNDAIASNAKKSCEYDVLDQDIYHQ